MRRLRATTTTDDGPAQTHHHQAGGRVYSRGCGSVSAAGGGALGRSMRYAETWLYGPAVVDTGGRCNCGDIRGCRRCGGNTRDVRGYGTVREGWLKSRPRLPGVADEPKDPYDMMRRSRLAMADKKDPRARSHSPPSKTETRKSILECDVNPYDLISNYLNKECSDAFPLEDDFSDALVEDEGRFEKNKRQSRQRTKQAPKKVEKKSVLDSLRPKSREPSSKVDLPIGGQRIRIFSAVVPPAATPGAGQFVSDSDEDEDLGRFGDVGATTVSPERPPRRPRTRSQPERKEANENATKTVNFRLTAPDRKSASLTSSASSEIKSILKKTQTQVARPKAPTSTERRLSTFKDKERTRHKKKQVQFRASGERLAEDEEEEPAIAVEEVVNVLPKPAQVTAERIQVDAKPQQKTSVAPIEPDSSEDNTSSSDGTREGVRVHRSLSDRVSPGGDPGSMFNDTMRLRLRTSRRDSRDTFTAQDKKSHESKLLSPRRLRPKQPPPPPPPPAINVTPVRESESDFQEQSKRVETHSLVVTPRASEGDFQEHYNRVETGTLENIDDASTRSVIPIPPPLPLTLPEIVTPIQTKDSESAFKERPKQLPIPTPLPPLPEIVTPRTTNHLESAFQDRTKQFETFCKENLDTSLSSSSAILEPPPPPPPPRQIFPFTKEQIEHINQKRKVAIVRPRSSSNSPVRRTEGTGQSFSRSTSLIFPIPKSVDVKEDKTPLWYRDSSVASSYPTNLLTVDELEPGMESFSSVTEIYDALERNYREINEDAKPSDIDEVYQVQNVKVPVVDNYQSCKVENVSHNCTIVTVASSTPNVLVTNPKNHPNVTSIMIIDKDAHISGSMNNRSSLVDDCRSDVNNSGSNRITINVGDYNYQNNLNKTGNLSNHIKINNVCKSNTKVTIGSNKETKKTFVILESTTTPETEASKTLAIEKPTSAETKIDLKARETISELIRNNVDPVEAARKSIIPHICGKDRGDDAKKPDEIKKESTSEQLESNGVIEKEVPHPTTDLEMPAEPLDGLEDVFSSQEDTYNNSDCYVCAKNLKMVQKGNDSVDEELRSGLEFDSYSNHYEDIQDPIYEEISDTPPPLPLSPPPNCVDINDDVPTRSIFEGASKYDILNYLETAKERVVGGDGECDDEPVLELSSSSRNSHLSSASDSSDDSNKIRKMSSVDIERNDSGVGSESSKCSRSRWQHQRPPRNACEDCEQPAEDSDLMFAQLVCRKCSKRRAERREIITEIVETEEKYGRDLRIVRDEFLRPMSVAGLLSADQLAAVFLNLDELLENSAALAEKLRDTIEIAGDQGDDDFLTVNIGAIFLDCLHPMLNAFESYCTRQGAASLLLVSLEKEKELLRIFLRVSQMENSVLRRMNLNSFLMVPVQRVTKYPLLLARLHRATPTQFAKCRDSLRLAQTKIELHLEHINSLAAKDISTTKLWRRISIINGRRSSIETDTIDNKIRKIAAEALDWKPEDDEEMRFALEGRLLFAQPTDTNWRRGRSVKLSPVNALLVTLGKPTEDYQPDSDDILAFPRKNGIRDASLLLLKEKSGRYGLIREPLYLDRCIVCCEVDTEEFFEVQELTTKDTYLFKACDGEESTRRWYRRLQYHAQGLGTWRRRRNALANIMIGNATQLRQ